jgi:inorganic pyrophosphatase/exopolyphosphatase
VVLVDHNNPDQMPGDLGRHLGRVVGVFDHHNIQPEFASKVIRAGAT